MVQGIFYDYLSEFMKVFVDFLSVAREIQKHLFCLWLCFQRCKGPMLKLNPVKCIFVVQLGVLLGHVVSKEGTMMDPDKIKQVKEMPNPINVKKT